MNPEISPAIPHYDVIILGAGSIGTPAAFYLAQAGLRTLVLDPAASVGQGSNKRAIGGVRATHSDPAKIRLCMRSLEIFSTWQQTYGDDIEWHKGGYVFVAYRPQEENTLKTLLTVQKKIQSHAQLQGPPFHQRARDPDLGNQESGTEIHLQL